MIQWKVINGYPGYEVSNCGEVRNIISGRVLKPWLNSGYPMVELFSYGYKKRFLVHRLVAFVFLDDPSDGQSQVNHKDGLKTNNHADNLEWVTPAENMQHAHRTNLMRMPSGDEHWCRSKTHCKHGHRFTPDNTYEWNGTRICKTCNAARQRKYREKIRG